MTDNESPARGPAPAGTQRLMPYVTVDDSGRAVDFYRDVLGAEVLTRIDGPDGDIIHAELRIGDSVLQLGAPMPDLGLIGPPAQGNAFTLTYWVEDPDTVFARAVAAGATPVSQVGDAFSGDRMGVFRCPFGLRWCVARHDRDVPVEEIRAAALAWTAEGDD
ncbi:VOC family protein [Polymorphospora rubra]|uniref:VOC family protein n=1 Tax=Polymorphospora rubra TaxID=338584 RepID=UPI0033C6F5A4